jgi:hypothetical protein
MQKTDNHHTCRNCHNNFKGNYCNYCGEKAFNEHDKKITHLFEEAFHFLTHFDNKFFRSLKLMFVKPGLVAKEFANGKTKHYYSPFSMFLVAIFLYLLFPTLQGLNISFYNHLNNNHYIGLDFPTKWANAKVIQEHTSLEELSEKFNHLSPKIAKVLLIMLVPLAALILRLLFRRKKVYFYDHFIFSSEYLSFFIFFVFFLLPILFSLLRLLIDVKEAGDSNLAFIVVQVTGIWLMAAAGIKRFYEVGFWKALLLSIIFLLLLMFMIFIIYRLIIFSIVMLLI